MGTVEKISNINLNFLNQWADKINNFVSGKGIEGTSWIIGLLIIVAGVIGLIYFLVKYR